jgi:hypothetical protein
MRNRLVSRKEGVDEGKLLMGGVTIGLGVLHFRFILGNLSKPAWGGDKVFRPKKLRLRGSAVQKVAASAMSRGSVIRRQFLKLLRRQRTAIDHHRVAPGVAATFSPRILSSKTWFLAGRASIIFRLREPTRMDEQAASCPSTSLRLRTTLAPAQFPQ